jgi:cyclopropane-fatty-acyl-phospholipid synthase
VVECVNWITDVLTFRMAKGILMMSAHSHTSTSAAPIDSVAPGQRELIDLLQLADIRVNGNRPWDMQVHRPQTFQRVLAQGSLGLGESYVDGWWDCARLDEMICRALRAGLAERVRDPARVLYGLKARFVNLQSVRRAWRVGREHYDIGNDLFTAMLDPTLSYSCAYWADADTLEAAQQAKLDLICRKLGLAPGMRLLDIGCGWGGLMRFAAEHYGVQCVGLTVSRAQAELGTGLNAQVARGPLPCFEFADYRQFNRDGKLKFDRIASVGMFEHVGQRNYQAFFDVARRSLSDDGLLLLHCIGKNQRDRAVDPWIERYIFPNGAIPSIAEITATSEPFFVLEDLHNFGADYDRTLMAWHQRFERAWPSLQPKYGDRFYRIWRYYLLACAGSFRARSNQLWQIVYAPRGVANGYRRPLL